MATPKKKEGRSKSFSMRYRVEEVPMATSEIHRNIPENESFNKDTGVHKYLKMIKPLYAKASKIRFLDQLSPRKQQGSRASSVFREVCRNLAKSRSAVGILPVPAPARRDDSALQQQDGIQSAILHCKRSYSSSSSSSTISQECSMLSRSASDSSYQKALRNSTEEEEK